MSRITAVGLLLVAVVSASAGAASFEDLGGTFGGGTLVLAGMSGDGQTLVGRTTGGSELAVRWTSGAGWTNLGALPGDSSASASAVSFDGSRVAGNGDVSNGMRWVTGSGWQALGLPNDARATALSADGSLVGGAFFLGGELVQHTGLVLQEVGQSATIYQETFAGSSIWLNDLTADGELMLATRSFTYGSKVVRVRRDGTTTFPPPEPQNVPCIDLCAAEARAISADGSTIVGGVTLDALSFAPLQAARWSGSQAPLALGYLDPQAPAPTSLALDVSGDGALVVGESNGSAFLWTEPLGMRDLKQALEATGLDLAGWTLSSARALSSDGSVLAGHGTRPGGGHAVWRAVAPELAPAPSPVPAVSGAALAGLIAALAAAGARAMLAGAA